MTRHPPSCRSSMVSARPPAWRSSRRREAVTRNTRLLVMRGRIRCLTFPPFKPKLITVSSIDLFPSPRTVPSFLSSSLVPAPPQTVFYTFDLTTSSHYSSPCPLHRNHHPPTSTINPSVSFPLFFFTPVRPTAFSLILPFSLSSDSISFFQSFN